MPDDYSDVSDEESDSYDEDLSDESESNDDESDSNDDYSDSDESFSELTEEESEPYQEENLVSESSSHPYRSSTRKLPRKQSKHRERYTEKIVDRSEKHRSCKDCKSCKRCKCYCKCDDEEYEMTGGESDNENAQLRDESKTMINTLKENTQKLKESWQLSVNKLTELLKTNPDQVTDEQKRSMLQPVQTEPVDMDKASLKEISTYLQKVKEERQQYIEKNDSLQRSIEQSQKPEPIEQQVVVKPFTPTDTRTILANVSNLNLNQKAQMFGYTMGFESTLFPSRTYDMAIQEVLNTLRLNSTENTIFAKAYGEYYNAGIRAYSKNDRSIYDKIKEKIP